MAVPSDQTCDPDYIDYTPFCLDKELFTCYMVQSAPELAAHLRQGHL